jgi:hypothetical protein
MVLHIPAGIKPANEKEAILLSELLAMTSTTKERRAGHWIPIHSNYWRRVLGRYAQVIREAEQRKLIEVNDRYSVGNFSMSYRLTKRLRVPDVQEWPLKRSTAPTARVRIAPDDLVGQRLVSHFEAVSVPQIDCSGWSAYSVKACQTRNLYATRCEYGRFHSTFTSIPKAVRSQLTFNDTPSVEIDVANCQSLIVGIQATRTDRTNTKTQPAPSYHMSHRFSDLGRYLDLCETGQLYEWLLVRCGHWPLRDWVPTRYRDRVRNRPLNRGDIKKQFIVLMFADIPTMKQLPIFAVVSREFPTIATYILRAKQIDYRDLARDCQRFEAALMVDTVAYGLGFPVVTIHDGLIVPVDRREEAKSKIESAFGAFNVGVMVR